MGKIECEKITKKFAININDIKPINGNIESPKLIKLKHQAKKGRSFREMKKTYKVHDISHSTSKKSSDNIFDLKLHNPYEDDVDQQQKVFDDRLIQTYRRSVGLSSISPELEDNREEINHIYSRIDH